MIKRLILVLVLIMNRTWSQTPQHSIIPEPVYYESTETIFTFDQNVRLHICTDESKVIQHASAFQDFLSKAGISVPEQKMYNPNRKGKSIQVRLIHDPIPELGDEGYILEVKDNVIELSANKSPGIFYGFQTLRQLLPPKTETQSNQLITPFKIQGCKIKDSPRFKWRGLMLDVSRHFFTVDEVKSFIDKMSQYKFNVFHWHLTDDEGWRIEIKSLPRLTEVGAWRVERHGRFGESRSYPRPGEKATYGGFYTQEEIKDVVQYAEERNITVVPEIDMPGHSMAVLAAYPELSTKKEKKFVNPGAKFAEWFGDGTFKMLIENTLNPTDEAVYDFVDKVFTEVAELFPGQYIHMGGDECYQGYWLSDLGVQKFMKKNNLKDGNALQSYFVRRAQKIINSKGKKMIGWDEILYGGLAEGAVVMSWRGMKGGIEAAKMGHEVIMSPNTHAYLDFTQGDHSVENPVYRDLSLEQSYRFEPQPDDVNPKWILGGQGNVWAEQIPNLPYAFYMTYPRAFALAEALWSPREKREWNSFIHRTESHFTRFEAANKNICRAVFDPIVAVEKVEDKLMCQLRNPIPGTEIYYTIDNTHPVQFGQKYTGPFEIPVGNLSLRTRTFRKGKPLGRELMIHRTELEKRADK